MIADASEASERPLGTRAKDATWFSHLENVGDPTRRKLMCLSLTRLLETNQPFILIKLQSLMTMWTDVVVELRNDAEDIAGDSLVYNSASAIDTNDEGFPLPPGESGTSPMGTLGRV